MAPSKLQESSLALWIRFAMILHCNRRDNLESAPEVSRSVWVCPKLSIILQNTHEITYSCIDLYFITRKSQSVYHTN